MSKKLNINIYTGTDTYSLEESLSRQVSLFTEKYGEHNISRIDASDSTTNWKALESEVVSEGFLAEKRLFILRNFVVKLPKKKITKEKMDESLEDSEGGEEEEEMIHARETSLSAILATIPDSNFLILIEPKIPKTKKLYKLLTEVATIKSFQSPYVKLAWEKRFPDLEPHIIHEVLRNYENRDDPKEPKFLSFDIYTSLEHIDLYGKSHTEYKITDFISLEKEIMIFSFLDEALGGNRERARASLHNILSYTNIYAFMGFLLSSLRTTLFLQTLAQSMKIAEIEKMLDIQRFRIEKALSTRVSEEKIRDFFHKLVAASIAQKSGKGMYESELGLIFFIELGILGLQKS